MKPVSNNQDISFFITHFFVLGEMMKALFDGLGLGFNVKFVLYQFPRNSWYVSGLPCEDAPIFLEEFDECKFLFGIQIASHMSNLRGVTQEQLDGLVELILRFDGQVGSL
jgi:hypothetical protein